MLSPLAPYRQIGILGSHIPIGMSDRPKLLILTDSRWPPEWHNNRYTWDNKRHKNKFRICQPASTPYSISWLMGYWLTGKFWICSCDKCVLVLCASRLPTSYCQKEISMANFFSYYLHVASGCWNGNLPGVSRSGLTHLLLYFCPFSYCSLLLLHVHPLYLLSLLILTQLRHLTYYSY